MSDSDSPEDKIPDRPLSPAQQLRHVLDALLHEERDSPKQYRLTTEERAALLEMRKDIDESRIDDSFANNLIGQVRQNLGEPEPRRDASAKERSKRSPERLENLRNEMEETPFGDARPLSPQEEKGRGERFRKVAQRAVAYHEWVKGGRPLWGEKALERLERSDEVWKPRKK